MASNDTFRKIFITNEASLRATAKPRDIDMLSTELKRLEMAGGPEVRDGKSRPVKVLRSANRKPSKSNKAA